MKSTIHIKFVDSGMEVLRHNLSLGNFIAAAYRTILGCWSKAKARLSGKWSSPEDYLCNGIFPLTLNS
jgi:hypothetical protein